MKNTLLFFVAVLLFASCQDNILQMDVPVADHETEEPKSGMQRLVIHSQMELNNLLAEIDESTPSLRRSKPTGELSNNEEPWMSLIEANRQKVMASLTELQLDSVANDEEELEFCPVDSVIADIQFAQLLNAKREIQYENTVYRYLRNGVAYTESEYESELKEIELLTVDIKVTPNNEGIPMRITQHGYFRPIQYEVVNFDTEASEGDDSGTGNGGISSGDDYLDPSTLTPITLFDGFEIPLADIRDINYYSKGDGNWFHRIWTSLWGRNVVAIKEFSMERRKLNLNFYDQNYIFYANIGTHLKMQKKVCGIWWNVKAEEMIQGWETVTIKYTMPEPVLPRFKNPLNNKNEYPTHAWNPFPYGRDNILLLTIPLINYDFTTRDLNKAFNAGLNFIWNKVTSTIKDLINNDSSRAGLMTFDNKDIYVTYGPYTQRWTNHKSSQTKFYKRWFPGNYSFGFSLGDHISINKIKFDGNDGVKLFRGRVYGAIKYKGEWRAARITKNTDK